MKVISGRPLGIIREGSLPTVRIGFRIQSPSLNIVWGLLSPSRLSTPEKCRLLGTPGELVIIYRCSFCGWSWALSPITPSPQEYLLTCFCPLSPLLPFFHYARFSRDAWFLFGVGVRTEGIWLDVLSGQCRIRPGTSRGLEEVCSIYNWPCA